MTGTATLRLDIWLWRTRLFRTRALSAAHVRKEGVRLTHGALTRRVDKPGTLVSVGDVVTFGQSGHILSVEVLDLGARRGPALEARGLYCPLEAS